MVFTITNDYVDALRVFLYSYLQYNKLTPPCVIIEEENITQYNKSEIKKIYPNVIFKTVCNNYSFDRTFKRRKWRINPAKRFEIFTLQYDSIVFFDADMIVCGNIEHLFSNPVAFGAVYHPNPDGLHSKLLCSGSKFLKNKNFNFDKCFNAGVMVINKQFLCEEVRLGLFKIYKSANWLGNQGPLNLYFNNLVTLLPAEYFISTPFITDSKLKNGLIFHYAGENKPWLTTSNNIEDNFDSGIVSSIKERVLLLKILTKYKQILNKIND